MNEKNELNDIILNRGGSSGGNKKIVLAVATLGVILIIVVMLMSTLTPDAKENLPQPIPLPVQQTKVTPEQESEPLFEEVIIIEEESKNSDSLDEIAKRLKKESLKETKIAKVKTKAPVKKEVKKIKPKKVIKAPTKEVSTVKAYFIQVGSFSKYEPNKKFLDSILSQGYRYKFHKVKNLTKVLVGPFYTEREARAALRVLRSNIEAGAFLVKL
ncbi:SPOR domain-containing protein [Sulfurimonas sp.]|uniref:SPOR domain-containing protein n=1 Tax=Sulfurimonas sp. TaxID=2022749 RepID=UPI002AB10C68|nr:SPOR domain-containing protein [Sulfurimonas sp.]